MFRLAFWCSIGLALFCLFHDSFSWSDPWLYVWMALWPFCLMVYGFIPFIIVVLGGILCVYAYSKLRR